MKIKKGDTVKILIGKDKGKTGVVTKVFPRLNKILVEGINVYKKHIKPKRAGQKGEIVNVSRPFYASKAMIVCKNCNKPTRVGYRIEGSKKYRYCKKCDVVLD
jgi:large subunit ribosomal protein L24